METMLIADDDNFMRLALRKVLEKYYYNIIEAIDGNEAVAAYNEHHPDCVLLDGIMPNLDGFSACNKIRATKKGKSVPILIVSGLSREEIKIDFSRTLAMDYISKPINWEKTLKKISKL